METPTVRKQKSGDQLAPGDWLAPDQLADGAAELLHVLAYRPSALTNVRENEKHVHLVVREQGKVAPYATVVAGGTLFDLASNEDLAELREAAERAKFAAGLREFADFVEANPWVPVKRPSGYLQTARLQIDLHGDDEQADASAVAQVREYAVRMGVKADESLDDRTDVSTTIGSVSYSVIAWHKGGRPAEPKPVADPTGLGYSRADDGEATQAVGRVEMHTGGVVEGDELVTDGGAS